MDQTAAGTSNELKSLILNSSGRTLTLGNNLNCIAYTQTAGIVNLNGQTLTLTGATTFPTTSANGTMSGSTSSNLLISATSITNSLNMTSGSQLLNNFTLNSSGKTLTFGSSSNITISGAFTQTAGIIALGAGNSLSLTGTVTFPVASTNGTITGTTTSSLSISASSITNSLFMTSGSQKLSGFTLNSPGQTLTLGASNSITVSGPYTQTTGTLNLNGNTLTLSGTVIFPTSAANGAFTGSAASSLSITATSISNSLFMDQTTAGTSNELKNFTLNSAGQTLTLGNNLVILSATGAYVHTNGFINLNNNTLKLNGAITFPATVSNGYYTGSSTSSILVGGSGNITNSLFLDQTTTGTTNVLSTLTLNRTGKTLTLGNSLSIIDSICPQLGTLSIGSNVTLVASTVNVGYTGRIGKVGGTLTATSITSNVYHAPPSGDDSNWMLMGTAGVTNATFGQWAEDFKVTCPSGCATASVSGTAFTSITSYNEPTDAFPAITGTASTIVPGVGYWVFMGNSYPGTASSPIPISVSGTPEHGTFSWPSITNTTSDAAGVADGDNGSNLLANPYPSPISWKKVVNDPLNTATIASHPELANIYIYSATYNGGDYLSYNGTSGISTPSYGPGANSIIDKIPTGGGFYVWLTTSGPATLKISEGDKVMSGSDSSFLYRQAKGGRYSSSSIPFISFVVNKGNTSSEASLAFSPNATLGNDGYDTPAFPWNGNLQASIVAQGKSYAVDAIPPLTQSYSVPLRIRSGTTTQYTLTPMYLQNIPSGACLSLHDNYSSTNANYDLRSGPIVLTINDTETVARFVLNITIAPFAVAGSYQNPTCANSGNGYMVANPSGTAPWNYNWKDINNNVIRTVSKSNPDTMNNANAGVYHVDVSNVGTCNSSTVTFTLQGTSSPVSLFTTPSNTVSLDNNDTATVTFTNNSTNATTYLWDFGDGTQAITANPIHQYTGVGVYVVSLTATNQLCGDNSTYSRVITVDTISSTAGIKSFTSNENNIFISRDQVGYYVQFNYQNKTNAVISVQNLLGEKVVTDINQENVLTNKTYIPLGNTENGVLIISVVTGAGEKTFRKIVN